MRYYSNKELSKIYQFNNKIRENLYDMALKCKTSEEQLRFVVLYMMNSLPETIVASIDETFPNSIIPFKYDYSFLEDHASLDIRERESRPFCNGSGYATSLNQGDCVRFGTDQVRIFPSFYAIKMGTCVMFANEIKRFAHEFGIECEIVETLETCYDNFNGRTTDQKPLKTNRLINMHHYYNIVTIDGKKYKIDVAGYLTAQDFNKNYPEATIDCQGFFFSEDLNKKPFENAKLKLISTQLGDN